MRKIFLYLYVLFIMPIHYTASSASTETSLKDFVINIKRNNIWLYKKEFAYISYEDLVKSYSLISSVPEGLVEEQPTANHKMIARRYIDNDTEGVSLWHSLEEGKELLKEILSSETNNGDISIIFENINNKCKAEHREKYFTDDEDLSQYIEQQKRNLFIHIDKHFGLISEKQITDLMKEGEDSIFLFFDKSKSLEDKKNFLLTTALNHENIQYIQEENSSNGSCIMVYSRLPKLDDAKLLGSAILGDANYRLIAVRNYLGECGMYLTDTVKIPFFIEESNNDKLMRFRISSIYPCDPQVFIKGKDERPDSWTINFSRMARMALINPDTSGIILDFLVRYVANKNDWITKYIYDIPLKKSFSLDDLPVNVAKNVLWDVRNFIDNYKDVLSNSNNMTTTLKEIKNYEECFKKLQKTYINQSELLSNINQSELLSNIYELKQKLEANNLFDNKIFYISNMVSLFTQIQKIVDRMPDNEVKGWCTQIEKSFETINVVNIYTLKNNVEEALNAILKLNDQISKLLSDLNKDEKQKVKTEDSINNIKTPALTNSLNNTAAENPPPPVPKTKSNKKKNNKGKGDQEAFENEILDSAIERNKKELELLIQIYDEEYQTLQTNVSDMKTATGKYFTFPLPDIKKAPISEWEKNIVEYNKQLLSLQEMYKKLEDNFKDKKQIAQQNNSLTQHDTQSSSLAATIKNDPTTIGESLIKLRQVVLKISSELKNEMPEEKK